MRLVMILWWSALVAAQQNPPLGPTRQSASIGEPSLPVVSESVCPFEGCTFREWSVEKDTTLFSTWQDGRHQVGEVKGGEKVQGLTGVYITRQPDRFLAMQPIPQLSLNVGDVVLQYGEWGEGYADLWARGVWHKDYDWGTTEDGHLVLADDNLKLVRKGIKEWWVQVKRADGLTGWAIANGNFGHMDRLGDAPDDSTSTSGAAAEEGQPNHNPSAAKPVDISEPALPVVDDNACPGKDRIVSNWKVGGEAPAYNSWQSNRTQVRTLWIGETVTILGSLQVIYEPDRVLVTKPIPELSAQTDDVVLRYSDYGEGFAKVWAKGEWHDEYYLAAKEMSGAGCQNQCNSIVVKNGIREWWVEIRNSSGHTEWVLGTRSTHGDFWDSGSFDGLCAD